MPEISFVTACMGRLHHLRQTLPVNLEAARRLGRRVELVVLSYNSPDGLDAWMLDNCAGAMRDGLVKYLVTREPTHFHTAHAKNVAHRAASGDIVFNLDADNMIGPRQMETVIERFRTQAGIVVVGSGHSTAGRIGMLRSDFLRLRGYSEEFHGWGCEDFELTERARRCLGLAWVPIRTTGCCLEHGDDERVRLMRELAGPPGPETDEVIAATMNPAQFLLFSQLRARSQALAASFRENVAVLNRLRASMEIAANGEDWGRASLLEPFAP